MTLITKKESLMSNNKLEVIETEIVDAELVDEEASHDFSDYVVLPLNGATIEALFAECMSQIKQSLDVVYKGLILGDEAINARLGKVDNMIGLAGITEIELDNVYYALGGWNNSSLNKKHRFCRKITEYWLEWIKELDFKSVKRLNNKKSKILVGGVTEFLSDMHIVLNANTAKQKRKSIMTKYEEN